MPRRRTEPFEDGQTFFATLSRDGSDADIRDLLNQDPLDASQTIKGALRLYASIQRGEIPPQLIGQWQKWARAELARQVAGIVIDELATRNLVVAEGVPPAVKAEVGNAVRDRFAETAQSEEL